jgi:predicted TIM-barrel fold metal-dependent hydrolase
MDADAALPAPIDCDLHNTVPSVDVLLPYLPRYWQEYVNNSAFKGPVETPYPPAAPTSARTDFRAGAEGFPGTRLEHLQRQALDPWQTEIGILNCAYALETVHNPDAAAALAAAVNDWQINEWLRPEPRLRASLVVPAHYPALAAAEIRRVGGHPGFVQVYLPVRSGLPYGNRNYHPLFAAAVEHDLVVGLHFGGLPGVPPTPSGYFSHYVEDYAGMASIFQSQVLSLIAEGAFQQFPALRVALIEGGFTWLPSLLWRLDKEWKGLRREIPWVTERPSDLIRRHVRLTVQPLDAPPTTEQMLQMIAQMESDELLLFATDYPHWHFDTPEQALPAGLPAALRRKILAENARAFYRL